MLNAVKHLCEPPQSVNVILLLFQKKYGKLFTFLLVYVRIESMNSILEKLNTVYPEATCELEYSSEFELLISVILSAQCTDKRVNIVTKKLFARANTAEAMRGMELSELEEYIKSCGLYKNKAKNILLCCDAIVEKFGGQVPKTMDELITLPGVGRKTANVMLSVAFNQPAIAVDTHVFRVAKRLGLSDGKTPTDVEKDLCNAFDREDYRAAHFLLIKHGRDCCHARNPDCFNCVLSGECKSAYIG